MTTAVTALVVGMAAFVAGLVLGRIWQRRRWSSRQQRRRKRPPLPGCEDIFPLRTASFRTLVRQAGERKSATLSAKFGRQLSFQAQDGEDMLLAEFFGYKQDGYFVEIGAYDGIYLSNSYFFEQLGWQGLLIEPLPDKAAACRRNRPNSVVVQAAVGRRSEDTIELTEIVGGGEAHTAVYSFVDAPPRLAAKARSKGESLKVYTVPLRTFDEIAAESGLLSGMPIDFISIDCEGMDFEVLKSISLEKWRPCLLIIEKVTAEMVSYLAEREYAPFLRIWANTIFGRETADRKVLSQKGYWQVVGSR